MVAIYKPSIETFFAEMFDVSEEPIYYMTNSITKEHFTSMFFILSAYNKEGRVLIYRKEVGYFLHFDEEAGKRAFDMSEKLKKKVKDNYKGGWIIPGIISEEPVSA